MNKFYFYYKIILFFIKKNYFLFFYNFDLIKNIILSFLKKKYNYKSIFIPNKTIINYLKINMKKNINIIIVKLNEDKLLNFLNEINNFTNKIPLFTINNDVFLEKFPIEFSKLSKKNLILKLLNFFNYFYLKLINLLKKL